MQAYNYDLVFQLHEILEDKDNDNSTNKIIN